MQTDTDFYEKGKHIKQVQTSYSMISIEQKIYMVLKKQNYAYNGEVNNNVINIAAEKNRFSMSGTLAVHLSLLTLIISILVGTFFGFKDEQFIVSESSAKEIGCNTNLTLYLDSFFDEYWEDGIPKAYSSEVKLYDNEELVKSTVVKVNHPLSYRGIKIYHSFYGPAACLYVESSDGEVIDQNIALIHIINSDLLQRPQSSMILPGSDYSLVIISNAINADDPAIGEDELGIEVYDGNMHMIGWIKLEKDVPQDIGGLIFTFKGGESQYSGFIVS